MSHYTPRVFCHHETTRSLPSYNSCKQMLDTMQWSTTRTEFGLPWQVRLSRYLIICGYDIRESLGVLVLKCSNSLEPNFTYHTLFLQVGSARDEM